MIYITHGIKEARLASERMDCVVSQLNLRLHKDKTVCILMGSHQQKQKMKVELQKEPLMCGNIETKLKDKFKWLGQILSSGGLGDSVAATVSSREGKIRGACLEIAQIVNDWRSHVAGGMETALLLWESYCVPSLLLGAGTWTQMTAVTEKTLDKLQCWYLRLIYQVGPGAPIASLLWDTSVLFMGLRVKIEKVMMIMHIRSLDEKALARMIYEEQKHQNWPGLASETAIICQELQVEDCNTTNMAKPAYRQKVIQACHIMNEKLLTAQAKGKCERISYEKYGKKDYIQLKNMYNVRKQYRSRFGLEAFAGNYSKDKRFA